MAFKDPGKTPVELEVRSKGKESQSERTSSNAYQDLENYYKKSSLRRIHKPLIDSHSPSEIAKQITSISIEPGVEVKASIADA
ncbi:40S ribosomal protein S20 [Plecturocebus cupreus]